MYMSCSFDFGDMWCSMARSVRQNKATHFLLALIVISKSSYTKGISTSKGVERKIAVDHRKQLDAAKLIGKTFSSPNICVWPDALIVVPNNGFRRR